MTSNKEADGVSMVTNITHVTKTGLYMPHTGAFALVVDDIGASEVTHATPAFVIACYQELMTVARMVSFILPRQQSIAFGDLFAAGP